MPVIPTPFAKELIALFTEVVCAGAIIWDTILYIIKYYSRLQWLVARGLRSVLGLTLKSIFSPLRHLLLP